MRKIKLTRGKYALVDDEDFELVNKYKWYLLDRKNRPATSRYYTHAQFKNPIRTVRMHRFILGLKEGDKIQVDHINSNGLDNRRSNLRICNQSQNQANRSKTKRNKSGYKGVRSQHKGWVAQIRVDKKYIYLGFFKNIKNAVLAYNTATKKYHGEFAKTK